MSPCRGLRPCDKGLRPDAPFSVAQTDDVVFSLKVVSAEDFPPINEMTVEEKAALVSGTDFMYTNPIPRLDIPSLCMSDGPHGLRKQTDSGEGGVSMAEQATAFPTAAATASSWDPDVTRRMGEAIAKEALHYGVHTLLGPGVNIKRNPLCGRNFEYFSEDPLLAGVMAAAETEGVQSQGVGVCMKHFAMNNSENYRFLGNSVASENTVRRLYLKPFEYVVKRAKPAALMCAYNQINGVFCSENKWLLTDVLRDEWGFDGVVMTDWGAIRDRVEGLKAGLDLEMPGDTAICRRWILDSVADGSLPTQALDKACRNILNWIDACMRPAETAPVDWKAHHALAAELAAECAVLMKNNGVLPLCGTEKLHITCELFENMRYQGSGSSMINPTMVTTTADVFRERGIKSVTLDACDTVLVFAGLTDEYESEGCDRENMRLPQDWSCRFLIRLTRCSICICPVRTAARLLHSCSMAKRIPPVSSPKHGRCAMRMCQARRPSASSSRRCMRKVRRWATDTLTGTGYPCAVPLAAACARGSVCS